MKYATLVLLAAAGFGLGACSNQYWQRTDTINFSAGDAVATNIAVQVPDPWPKRSTDTRIPMDPVKATNAIERYRTPHETITNTDVDGSRTSTSGNTPGLIGTPNTNINMNQGK
jgi:hypothetical protein